MDNDLLEDWKREAAQTADRVVAAIEKQAIVPLPINSPPREATRGSNSSDAAYVERLLAGRHLTASFLADAYKPS